MNNVALIGRLTRAPELKHLPSGDPVCEMSIAVDSAGDKGPDGYGPGFFDVIVFGKTGENSATYLVKGQQVGIEGRLRHHRWEANDGTKRSKIEILANRVDFLAKPKAAEGEIDYRGATPVNEPAATNSGDFSAPDDDIPF